MVSWLGMKGASYKECDVQKQGWGEVQHFVNPPLYKGDYY